MNSAPGFRARLRPCLIRLSPGLSPVSAAARSRRRHARRRRPTTPATGPSWLDKLGRNFDKSALGTGRRPGPERAGSRARGPGSQGRELAAQGLRSARRRPLPLHLPLLSRRRRPRHGARDPAAGQPRQVHLRRASRSSRARRAQRRCRPRQARRESSSSTRSRRRALDAGLRLPRQRGIRGPPRLPRAPRLDRGSETRRPTRCRFRSTGSAS